jgi:hypothetical protein
VAAIIGLDSLAPYRVELCVLAIAVMTLGNLRGLKESGKIFAGPTYLYVLSMIALIVYGLFRSYTGDLHPIPPDANYLNEVFGGQTGQALGLFVLLRAFSSGAWPCRKRRGHLDDAFRPPERQRRDAHRHGRHPGSLFFGLPPGPPPAPDRTWTTRRCRPRPRLGRRHLPSRPVAHSLS